MQSAGTAPPRPTLYELFLTLDLVPQPQPVPLLSSHGWRAHG